MGGDKTDVEIVIRGVASTETLADLSELNADLAEAELGPSPSTVQLPAVKMELTLAIAIAGLALSAISTLVSVLAHWQSRKPKYSISVPIQNRTIELSNLSKQGAVSVAEEITREDLQRPLVVRVSC